MVDTKATDSKKGEVNPENIIPISMEKLTPEQKAEFELMKDNLQNQFLQSFKQTRSGVIQKYKLMMSPNTDPEPSTSKGDKPKTDGPKDDKPEEETPLEFENFQGQIDYAVHQALINQSGVLVNTLTNIIKSVVDGTIAEQQVRGPTFLPNGASSSAQKQPVDPYLLSRQQPQHVGHNIPQLTQEQIAAMFKTNQQTIEPIPMGQQSPIIQHYQPTGAQFASGQPIPNIQQAPLYNINFQYQPQSPQMQYRPGGSPQPQILPPFNQFEQVQQPLQRTPQHKPWADMIVDVMRDQFVLKPKDTGNLYRHPYHEYFERVPLPNRYKVPDFSKFSGQDNVSTYEHVSRFLAQCVLM
uniref:Retrotransposon protein, putative, unclassified n=1 Tax=Oryza sativa subsp. japonica TaxID=39947 RepID=Q60DA9_ORYSJ|nr:retrotransposon protein, putative, unclassified [Oryza sativa Japonica Group]